jgi:hypothetical protein
VRESDEIEEADIKEVGREWDEEGEDPREMDGVPMRDLPRSTAGDSERKGG